MSRRSPDYDAEYDRGNRAGRDADKDRERERSDRDRERERPDRTNREKETMPIGKDDAAFVLGRNGSTKKKIARVCGADLDLNEHDLVLEIYGEESQRAKARDYVQYVTQQRVGPVHIDLSTGGRNDLTVMDVPEDCVGFVMGKGGNTLRSMEDEWGTLMFFAQVREPGYTETEKLCIFGTLRARRGAELKVMSAVEHKHPGHFVRGETLLECRRVPGDDAGDDWATDTMMLTEDNFSYALGSKGSTRRKLATASACIIEYVGRLACICGNIQERRRARDYIKWLIAQRTGTVSVDTEDRDDVTVVEAPTQTIGFITGYRGESLRRIEAASGTFCFTDAGDGSKRETEKVLIFSADSYNRKKANSILLEKIQEHKEINRNGGGGRGGYGGGGGGGYGGGGGGYGGGSSYGGGGGGYGGGGGGYGRDRSRSRDRDRDRDRDRRDRSRDRDDRRDRSRSRDRDRRR
jgi:predicted RNA-binding protein Jag